MVSVAKYFGLMSCGFLLCMGLSNSAQAADGMKGGTSDQMNQSDQMKGGQADRLKGDQPKGTDSERGNTIKGEVLRVEGDTYFVKGQDGKEVRLRTDGSTQRSGVISQGDRIEAKVNDQNLALSIRSAQGADAGQGNDSDRLRDSTNESGRTGSAGR